MQVKEAVANAKQYLADLFREEGLSDLGLEEVEFDESTDSWCVTLGFSRPWDLAKGLARTLLESFADGRGLRTHEARQHKPDEEACRHKAVVRSSADLVARLHCDADQS